MFSCVLCERETVILTHLCEKCRRVKHLINLYEDRVYDVLENVLVRNEEGQLKKESQEIEKKKDYNLRNNKSSK